MRKKKLTFSFHSLHSFLLYIFSYSLYFFLLYCLLSLTQLFKTHLVLTLFGTSLLFFTAQMAEWPLPFISFTFSSFLPFTLFSSNHNQCNPTRLSQPTMLTFVYNEEKLRNMKTCSFNEHVYYVGWIHGAVHPIISPSNPLMEEIFNSTFQLEFMPAKSIPDLTFFIIFINIEKISSKLIPFILKKFISLWISLIQFLGSPCSRPS